MIPKPITREELYLSYIINGSGILPKPITRRDMYLYYLCINGFDGEGGSAEALSGYVTKNMMSGQQVNDENRIPTSALAYAMAQGIAANANNIAQLNNNFENSLRYRYKFSGDFNNLDIKPGIYFLETSQTWTNGPSPSPAYCMFIQFPAYRFQMIIDAHKIYTRKHTGSPPSWSLWRLHDSGESSSDVLLHYNVPKPLDNQIFTLSDWYCYLTKSGNIVTAQFNFKGRMIAANTMEKLLAIPTIYAPRKTIVINYIAQSGTAMAVTITEDGDVQFYNAGTSISDDWICRQTITYVTDK